MIFRDRYGYPIEKTKGKYISNFIRLLIFTDLKQTWKRRKECSN